MKGTQCWIRSDGATRAIILSPSLETPGGWRLTSWDQIGPSGHTEHSDREAAKAELRRRTGPWEGIPEFGVKARPAEYEQVETEPTWLGLTVITSGRIEQKAA